MRHELVRTGDSDAAPAICDRNGEVSLAYCRRCHKGEGELGETCDGFLIGERTGRVHVLDHGYVELVETWGDDRRIVEAARMSTGKGFLGWGVDGGPPGDEKLLASLYANQHLTPFEMAGAVFEIQAPISVFRQWQRHRTQSYNEHSARYSPLPDVSYVPTLERLMEGAAGASGANKQAGTIKGAEALTRENAERFREALRAVYGTAEELYRWALEVGIPKELAREHLPVGRYSRMRASANLRNWFGFLTLRLDDHAQWEIRQFAGAVAAFLARSFPRSFALFEGGRP